MASSTRRTPTRWTAQEDADLTRIVNEFRLNDNGEVWRELAARHNELGRGYDRSHDSCRDHWKALGGYQQVSAIFKKGGREKNKTTKKESNGDEDKDLSSEDLESDTNTPSRTPSKTSGPNKSYRKRSQTKRDYSESNANSSTSTPLKKKPKTIPTSQNLRNKMIDSTQSEIPSILEEKAKIEIFLQEDVAELEIIDAKAKIIDAKLKDLQDQLSEMEKKAQDLRMRKTLAQEKRDKTHETLQEVRKNLARLEEEVKILGKAADIMEERGD